MSKKLSRNDALEIISTWNTNDVLCLLKKNGLEECCTAISKRQIDGDELLHLTEGKLALWKSDLTRSLIWELRTLVEQIKKFPEKYVQEKNIETEQNEDHMSDTSSWDTDFEDEITEDHHNSTFTDTKNINDNQINSNYGNDCNNISTKMKTIKTNDQVDENTMGNEEEDEETTYENFESTLPDDKSVYANYKHNMTNQPLKNVSRLHGTIEKSLAEQLKEQLELRNSKKPVLGPKPEGIISKRPTNFTNISKQPRKSFLHDDSKTKPRPQNDHQRRMAVPPPPTPKKNVDQILTKVGKDDQDLSKPSISIRNLDLIANLPTRQEESEGEYEQFDEQIIEQNQRSVISRIDSKQSLTSGAQSSVESIYQSPSTTSCEEEQEHYEIYESITEPPEDNDNYLRPIQRTPSSNIVPPPLPIKPAITPPPTLHLTKSNNANERSPDKKSATLPHSGSNTSLSLNERTTRPLPPPPDRVSYINKPWYHNVTRSQAITLISEQSTYGTPQDGYFLFRPSTTNVNSPLALVLWCKDRVYNIPVRKRSDNRYALGSPKLNEQSFSSVEEIVTCYTKEELVLYTGGVQTGSTKLTDTPK
ncbi:PREDICTED: uncharacterized protein LOC106790383 [Polistes canadensis]|uniref:uncharacterized protein LOC106790383 n=1 Tax=Polistes canadensis TaxID=91411 RepID=UPI000718F98A|nr:PREDICTED: uncharacterized protein LOC106790383 [Polistes canadensis]